MLQLADAFPAHWNFVFQIIVLSTIVLILWQIKVSQAIDRMRHNDPGSALFLWRRAAMFLKALGLVWMVEYSHAHGWAPWPPIVGFLLAVDLYVICQTLIMSADINRIKQRQGNIQNVA